MASGGVFNRETIGEQKNKRLAVKSIEAVPKRRMLFPAIREMLKKFFAPKALPIRTVVPMAKPTIITVKKCMT